MNGFLEKAEQKLRAAEELLKVAAYEDAVSRAYYCAFHAAQAVLLAEGLSARTHQGVVNLFGLHIVKTGIIIYVPILKCLSTINSIGDMKSRRHCEARSAEAISTMGLLRFARNDINLDTYEALWIENSARC